MSLMEQLTRLATDQVARAAAEKTGLSEGAAAKLMPMAMAVLMNGLKTNAANPSGAEALARALDGHDGSVLQNPAGLNTDSVLADGQKILGHILGAKRGAAEAQLAKAAGGLDQSQVAAVLAMAAPAVLGALGKAKREQGLDPSGLSALVRKEGQAAMASAPGELSGLMKMLDTDGDGNLNNEAMGIGKRLLGSLFGRKK